MEGWKESLGLFAAQARSNWAHGQRGSMRHLHRGFLVILDAFPHRFRDQLRCDVPPGLTATELTHFPAW
jgi:hypothetical protein